MDTQSEDILRVWQQRSLWLAVAGLVLSAMLTWQEPDLVWRAYLFAFIACWLLTMGATGLLALGNLTGGRWATFGRPFYLSATQLLPHVAVLFIPIALCLERIYPWAATHTGTEHALAPAKAVYLEPSFFMMRAVGYFVVWLVVGTLLARVSRFDVPAAERPGMSRVGALSLVLLVPTTTFAAFDWGMSLEPEWYSSIYGAVATAAGVLAAQALAIYTASRLPAARLARILTLAGVDTAGEHEYRVSHSADEPVAVPRFQRSVIDVFHDQGNLQLAFLMVTMYFAFSQFLIIWSGNLPTEITWYMRRLRGGWQVVALGLVLLHFAVPFLLSFSRDVKRSPRRLARVALLVLAMYDVHIYWMIVPAFATGGLRWHATNVAALAALGGLWMMLYCWNTRRNLGRFPTND